MALLDDMINELREITGYDTTDLPTDKATLFLNRSFREIQNKYHLRIREVSATFSTVVGTSLYERPDNFDALREVHILNSSGGYDKLTRLSTDQYQQAISTETSNRTTPTGYLREGQCIKLAPIPDDIYTIVLRFYRTLTDMSSTNTDPDLPVEWNEIMVYGGAWRAFLWKQDFESMEVYKGLQASIIQTTIPVEAKEETDSSTAGVEVLGRDYNV